MNHSEFQTVGMRLQTAREALGISLEDASRATSIKFNHLQELENDHPEQFNSAVQARGFLRLYASFLNLDGFELITLWETPAPADTVESSREKESVSQYTMEQPEPEIKEAPSSNSNNTALFGEAAEITETPPILDEKAHAGWIASLRKKIQSVLAHIPIPQKIKVFLSTIKLPAGRKQNSFSQPEEDVEESRDIFKEIGAALRDRRVAMDLDLTDIEHFTNLKRMVLVAIEDGRFNDLPSTVQGRGMLNNYAKFLAMDDSAVMDRYAQALQLQREERMPRRKTPEPAVSVKVNLPEGMRKVLNPDLLLGGTFILALFAFILWGASQMLSSDSGQPTEAPSISEMLQMTPSVSPTPDLTLTADAAMETEQATALPGVVIAQSTPTPVATANAAPLQLYIIAHDRAYLRVTVDGVTAFDGRVIPDNVYTYSGNDLITLLTGNGAALEIYFNQEYLGSVGTVGEVVDLRFSLQGLQTPTPATQPTPTESAPEAMTEETIPEGNELP